MVEPVDALLSALHAVAPGVSAQIDAPNDPRSETRIDLSDRHFTTEVSYRPEIGFGAFVSAPAFGQRPDEVYRAAPQATHCAIARVLRERRFRNVSHFGGDPTVDGSDPGKGRRGAGDQATIRPAGREQG
jgi:hypothetical protein